MARKAAQGGYYERSATSRLQIVVYQNKKHWNIDGKNWRFIRLEGFVDTLVVYI